MSLLLAGLSFIAFLAMLLLDRHRPARKMPEVQGPWRWWGLFFFLLTTQRLQLMLCSEFLSLQIKLLDSLTAVL